jgi:hypothetical protein
LKYCLLISLFILASACGENIESYDKLTKEEQEYIRTRASAECLADSAKDFTTIKKNSNAEMAKYEIGDFWKLVQGSTTDYLYVWKVSGTNVYFLYQQKLGSTTYHKFIKMTAAFNGEMIDSIRTLKCDSKNPAITNSSSSFSVKFLDVLSTEGTSKYKTDTTYSGTSGQPGFYSTFSQKIFKEKFKKDSDDIESSENLTATITYESDDAELLATYAEYSNKQYCVYKYTPGTTAKAFVYPFDLNCVDGASTNANPGTDTTLDFTAAELVR